MKKFFVCGKNPERLKEIEKKFESQGFELSNSPEIIIVSGGDGSLLISERKFPGIPKLLIRDSLTCKRCYDLDTEGIIEVIKDNNYKIKKIKKIKAKINDKEIIGLNDIIIKNKNPNTALRFEVFINDEIVNEFIGDGVVIATHYGSTGYFSSITGKDFKKGIGIAFNNVTDRFRHINLENNDKIKIKIKRGPGILSFDNSCNFIELKEDDEIEVNESDKKARIIML